MNIPDTEALELQIAYWQQPPMGHAVEGMWSGDGAVLDDKRYDHDGLAVLGVDGDPEFFASLAGCWLAHQLRRPIERLDWMVGNTLVASRWRLADTGAVVSGKGASWWRAIKRAPTAVTRIR